MASLHSNQCCVWDTYKYTLYTKFREPWLYRFAAKGDWDLIPNRCKKHPKEANFVHKYAPKDTPLNRLLRTESCSQCSEDMRQNIFEMKHKAVAALLDVNVNAALYQDSFQRTPLHWACIDAVGNHGDLDDSIIFMLIEKAPQAVHMTDMEKRTPLHYLVARNDEVPLKVLAKLVAICPEALNMKDEVGETPLAIIKSRREELHNVDDLLRTLMKLESLLTPSTDRVLCTV